MKKILSIVGRFIGTSYTVLIAKESDNRIIDMFSVRAFDKSEVAYALKEHLEANFNGNKDGVYKALVMNNHELLAFAEQPYVKEQLQNI